MDGARIGRDIGAGGQRVKVSPQVEPRFAVECLDDLLAGRTLHQVSEVDTQGRARLGLALALLNAPPAVPGQPVPDLHNPDAVEAAEFSGYFVGAFSPMFFIEFARPAIEQSAGGNGSWTLGSSSICEWKGATRYFSVSVGGRRAPNSASSYLQPTLAFGKLKDHLAFHVARMDACYVDDEQAMPQLVGNCLASGL